jgi:uncharacterized protein
MTTKEMYFREIQISICVVLGLVFPALNTSSQTITAKYIPKAEQIKPLKANVFFVGEVNLLDSPFKESQDAEAKAILSLNLERLLAPYLIESGLTPKGLPYLGWETEKLPGVALSFYLSGAARIYMETGNIEFLNHINYALAELERCQQANGGYLLGTADGKAVFARIEHEGCYPGFAPWTNGQATPYYSLEKLMSGLRDVYRICHIEKALQISIGIGDWLYNHMSFISDTEIQKLMWTEYGGMNWVLSDLYADTGDMRYLELSKRWQDNGTVSHSVQGTDNLNKEHANMQFPKFSGLAARYPYSGNASDLFGARFFWENVVYHRTYVTGGNSESEYFGPRDSLSHRLTPYTEENCNEYNMLRFTSLLYQIEPKVEYADYFERTLFNHILAAQNPADSKICYFLPLMPGSQRVYENLEEFSCCVCSSLDSYTRHGEYIYSHTGSAVYVNLFIASELNFAEKGITIKQETTFPNKDISTLTFQCNKRVQFDLCIRNPYWANNRVAIKINGKKQKLIAAEDGYFHILRNWKTEDVVELKLPMQLRSECMPDDINTIALFYGPILLSACLDKNDAANLVSEEVAPALVANNLPLEKWLTPTGEPLTFNTTILKPNQVKVMPFYLNKPGHYSVYWQLLTENEWMQREAKKQQKLEAEKNIELRTIDKVIVCDSMSEANHKFTGTTTKEFGNNCIFMEICWRSPSAIPYGYEMSVSDSLQNTLFCKYMGRVPYEIWSSKITVDGTTIQTLIHDKDDSYPVVVWQAQYPIPLELTKGKQKVTVLFEPIDSLTSLQTPRVVEMRILTK